MALLLHIIKFKLRSSLVATFDLKVRSMIKGIASLLIFGGFAVGAYLFSYELTRFTLDQTRTGLFLYHRFLSMLLFVFFVSVNLGNIIVSYATLYRSQEVRYLLTTPVPHRTVFVLKFLDNFLYSSTTLFLLAISVFAGYCSYFGYSWLSVAGGMIFLLVPFMFLAACLGVLVLMSIMKLAGRWGFRRVMTGLAGLYITGIYVFFEFSNPVKLVGDVFKSYPNINIYLGHLDPKFMKFLPSHWVAEFLFFTSIGNYQKALPFLVLLILVTSIAFLVVLIVGEKFYYRSWLISLPKSGGNRIFSKGRKLWFSLKSGVFLPKQIDVLFKKEILQFLRDPSQWIHLLLMILLSAVFALSVRGLNFRFDVPDLPAFTYLVLFAFGGFVIAALALRFAFPMISLEGRAFWILRSSPLDAKKIFFLKFLTAFSVVLLFGVFISFFTNIPFLEHEGRSVSLLFLGFWGALMLSAGMVSLNLGMGGYFANYHEKNPIRIASSQGATMTFLVTFLFLVMVVTIISVPITTYFSHLLRMQIPHDEYFLLASILMGVISSVFGVFGISVGLYSLKRDL